jgi:enediyne biosynthesis thioesterase
MKQDQELSRGDRYYEYRYIVGFKDTNVVGNVYFTRHLEWQGMCREMFVRDHAPEILDQLEKGLCFVTMHASCDYRGEINAFDEIAIRMRLDKQRRNRAWMDFEYVRILPDGREETVAVGKQTVACMRREQDGMFPEAFPERFVAALEPFSRRSVEPVRGTAQ